MQQAEGLRRALPESYNPSEAVERRLLRRGLRPRWRGEPPPRFRDLATDSRSVERGDLFCAIVGTVADGHEFVAAAARAGALAAVVEHPVASAGIPQLVVSDTHAAAAHLASLFSGDPGDALYLVGVTGTNGKTTTAWLCRHLLADQRPCAALGTLGTVSVRGKVQSGGLTTPGPIDLMRALARLRREGATAVAMEVSSHALDQRRVDALRFDTVAFTNLSREHLEYHPDLQHYLETKLRLAELLKPEGICARNADEPAWDALDVPDDRLLAYGLSPSATVRAEDVQAAPDGNRWRLRTPAGDARVDLPYPGSFNVSNALAATAVALAAGMVPARIAELLATAPPVSGRMEVLRRRPSLVLRDYAHTPDAFERVLGSLRDAARGRLFVVFGCGGDRDTGKRPLMGSIAARLADLSLVTTDNARSEDPAEIAADIVAGMEGGRYEVVLDRRAAIARALELAANGDVVVLLGKGHEDYQILGEERLPFDEAAIVDELVAETAGAGERPATAVERVKGKP